MAPRLVILDRDGVINEDSAEFIKSPEEWRALPGSMEALGRLHAAGRTVAVASNQSGVGRGLL
ncbi:MAG: HAD-IIIA family hydrolase, partial [Gammaproteobacteria bacterium]|nr:HAD-IIIA family hydrolase [Gammaproteobacteria bacterium]